VQEPHIWKPWAPELEPCSWKKSSGAEAVSFLPRLRSPAVETSKLKTSCSWVIATNKTVRVKGGLGCFGSAVLKGEISIKPSGYEFSKFEKYWAAFFIPAWFVLPYITRAVCYRALPAWKQAWHLNHQQCRLMCSLYVTKLGPS